MDLSPSLQEHGLVCGNGVYHAPLHRAAHLLGIYHAWPLPVVSNLDLRFAIAVNMDVGRRMVIDEDHEAQAMLA